MNVRRLSRATVGERLDRRAFAILAALILSASILMPSASASGDDGAPSANEAVQATENSESDPSGASPEGSEAGDQAADSNKPADPEKPAGPDKAAGPEQPEEDAAEQSPAEGEAGNTPADPDQPADPEESAGPEQPAGPNEPKNPDTAADPEKSANSDQPADPEKPAGPEQPERDATEESPAEGEAENTPADPEKPEVPEEPAIPTAQPAPDHRANLDGGDPKAPEKADTEPTDEPDAELRLDTDRDSLEVLSVPNPTGNDAVINVSVGGDRTASSSVGSLAGVKLQLYTGGEGGPDAPVSAPWATCVSDVDGDCSFTIPDTQPEITERGACIDWVWFVCVEYEQIVVQEAGANHDTRFWVVATDAPSGWYLNAELQRSGSGADDYTFRTPGVEAGETYESGDEFMSDGSSGIWQTARTNPELPYTCESGLNAALILDLSGSVANAGAVDDLKGAAKDMVGALYGTGSSIALYTFAEDAPRNNDASGQNYASMPIDDGNNLATIESRIDAYSANGGTNWDEGIYQVAADAAGYDLAIVITDGRPTYSHDGGNGSSTRFAEVEHAIFSANALKAQGTRVLAVGVGDGISGSPANLRAVSGQTAYAPGTPAIDADFFQSDWSELAGLLEQVARGATCQATIDVVKQTLAYGADEVTNGGSGWHFRATATAGTLTPAAEQVTDGTGTVSWTLGFTAPGASTTVTVDELLSSAQTADGWTLAQATCTINDGNPTDPTDMSVTAGDSVQCVFRNEQQLVPGIEVVKQAWDVATAAELPGANEITDGGQVVSGSTVTWTYTVTNTGETVLNDIAVVDNRVGAASCPQTTLQPTESMTCTASGLVTALP